MKVEHITLGGNSVIRDTADIFDTTSDHFELVGWKYQSQTLHLPDLPFAIKITATNEGAIFDIQKAGRPVIMNACGFDGDRSMLSYVRDISDALGSFIPAYKEVIEPVTPNWLYSCVINPLGLNPEAMMIAGEVELYIFEQLYKAWINR